MKRPPCPGLRAPALLASALILLASDPAPADGPGAGESVPKSTVSEQAANLRNLGLAQLENEQPGKAEATYRSLTSSLPEDPLGHANFSIALLRQQKNQEALAAIDRGLAVAEKSGAGRQDLGPLLAIRAEVLQWSGRRSEALAAWMQAVAAAPENPEILYGLYRHATTLESEEADRAAEEVRQALVRLRPENLVVLLAQGRQAIAAGNRTAASGVYLRVGELLWQAEPIAERAMGLVMEALKGPEVSAARVPALRLENVLKISPMYRESLRELSTGIQGVPIDRFLAEPEPSGFGEPIPLRFTAERLSPEASAGRALATGDFNGDQRPDNARLVGRHIEVRLSGAESPAATLDLPAGGQEPPAPPAGLLTVDLDNDGNLDLLAYGLGGAAFFRGDGSGAFAEATAEVGLGSTAAGAAVAFDFDIEGDLDLSLAGPGGAGLWRNALQGPLEDVSSQALPKTSFPNARQTLASDLDRDGDLDLISVGPGGVLLLDNLRQGRFEDRTREAGLGNLGAAFAAASADLDNDGYPDLVLAGPDGLAWVPNATGDDPGKPLGRAGGQAGSRFEAPRRLPGEGPLAVVIALDADNDGHLDLGIAGEAGIAVLRQLAPGRFRPVEIEGAPTGVQDLAAADFDGDGDLDLAAAGARGHHRLINEGGNQNPWLAVRLRGLDKGSSKNNALGLGSVVELKSGRRYQFREATGDVTHFGLGADRRSTLLRVVWTNGVPQQRLQPVGNQQIVEEQLLKGSCPFLYAWDGERFAFVTDLLWGSPLGLPVGPGVWAGADPGELVRVDGAQSVGGRYRLRITEELWEAAFFDRTRLWVVDHPPQVEVASNLRIVPGKSFPDRILASRDLRPLAQALDGRGRDVTAIVAERDEVYADGFRPSRYQGIADEPWTFTLDLGEEAAAAIPAGEGIRLHLDGWIFPADASLNLAVAQRSDLSWDPPRLEVELTPGAGDWQVLMPSMGFPAGKTKTLVVDTPPLPAGAEAGGRRLRIVTTQWLSWDRIAWTVARADDEPRISARLDPLVAELRYRGFSRLERQAPNAPHHFVYADATEAAPWLPLPGLYTRFGDVVELLTAIDDRSVILAAGDEMALEFDASALAPPPPGWRRTVFLESVGWDKDADRNTWEASQLEPLPFHGMSGYPYGPGEAFPETPELVEYRREWLTRRVEATPPEPQGPQKLRLATTGDALHPAGSDK